MERASPSLAAALHTPKPPQMPICPLEKEPLDEGSEQQDDQDNADHPCHIV